MTFAVEETQPPRLSVTPPHFVPLLPKVNANVPGVSFLLSRLRSPFALGVSALADAHRVGCSLSTGAAATPVSPDDVAVGTGPHKKRPRAATHASEDCDSAEADDEADDDRYPHPPALSRARSANSSGCPERKRAKQQQKWRKPTYLVRKEERDVLLSEIRALEAKVDFLRRHAGLSPGSGATADAAPGQQTQTQTLVDTELHNNLLRESMRNQQLQLLSAQSAMSELAMQCALATAIRLQRDWSLRRETLVALKHDKLRDARLLLDKRTQFLQTHGDVRETFEQAHFVTARGDLCILHFDVVPVEGVGSVRQAFVAVQGYMKSVQHADSQEESNNVIHDHQGQGHSLEGETDDDNGSILHRRVLIAGDDLPCEANFVVFSELTPATCAASSALGTVAFDYVDEDELYPYRPQEFMRQDVTGAVNVAMRARRSAVTGGQESVLVLTRWVFITVHRDGQPIPAKALEAARIRISRTSDEMVRAVRSHKCS